MITNAKYPINLNLFLKPLILVLINRNIRKTIIQFVLIIKRAQAIFYLFVINIIAFAVIGRVLFANLSVDNNIFISFFESMYYLFLLSTSNCFPDLMLPFYEVSRLASIYFIIFLLINYVLMINAMIALIFASYKLEIE